MSQGFCFAIPWQSVISALFIHLLAMVMLLKKMSVHCSSLLISLICFFVVKFLTYFGYYPFIWSVFTIVFSKSIGFLSLRWFLPLLCRHFNLMQTYLSIFAIVVYAFWEIFKKYSSKPTCNRSFIVPVLIFMHGMRQTSSFILLHVDVHLLQKLSFIVSFWWPHQNLVDCLCIGLFLDSILSHWSVYLLFMRFWLLLLCSIIWNQKGYDLNFFLLKVFLDTKYLLWIYTDFEIFYIPVKNTTEILINMMVNLNTILDSMNPM